MFLEFLVRYRYLALFPTARLGSGFGMGGGGGGLIPEEWTKVVPGIPLTEASSSSRTPRQASGRLSLRRTVKSFRNQILREQCLHRIFPPPSRKRTKENYGRPLRTIRTDREGRESGTYGSVCSTYLGTVPVKFQQKDRSTTSTPVLEIRIRNFLCRSDPNPPDRIRSSKITYVGTVFSCSKFKSRTAKSCPMLAI